MVDPTGEIKSQSLPMPRSGPGAPRKRAPEHAPEATSGRNAARAGGGTPGAPKLPTQGRPIPPR